MNAFACHYFACSLTVVTPTSLTAGESCSWWLRTTFERSISPCDCWCLCFPKSKLNGVTGRLSSMASLNKKKRTHTTCIWNKTVLIRTFTVKDLNSISFWITEIQLGEFRISLGDRTLRSDLTQLSHMTWLLILISLRRQTWALNLSLQALKKPKQGKELAQISGGFASCVQSTFFSRIIRFCSGKLERSSLLILHLLKVLWTGLLPTYKQVQISAPSDKGLWLPVRMWWVFSWQIGIRICQVEHQHDFEYRYTFLSEFLWKVPVCLTP